MGEENARRRAGGGGCPPRPVCRDVASPYAGGMGRRPAAPCTARAAQSLWGFDLNSLMFPIPSPPSPLRARQGRHALLAAEPPNRRGRGCSLCSRGLNTKLLRSGTCWKTRWLRAHWLNTATEFLSTSFAARARRGREYCRAELPEADARLVNVQVTAGKIVAY